MPTRNEPKDFIFCVHAHQPVGNFEHVFEEAVDTCYGPFFDVVAKHPRVPVVFHMSGSLIDWLESRRPDFLEKLRGLSRSHPIEFLGGAYYEPIYGLIPERDLAGQIRRMNDKLAELFGAKPSGAWLTERVWDPQLAGTLTRCGVSYTVLDDAHFESAGLRAPVTGYYRVLDGKGSLDLFASNKALRYLVPFSRLAEVMRWLRSARAGAGRAVVFADDCEKFGLWPGTARWVYGEGWLDRFFTLLENDPGIRMTTFSRFRAEHAPVKDVTVPHGSYQEMMDWSGGRFYNFFDKYPESRYMKERMLKISERVAHGEDTGSLNGRLEESKTALYRAQCNCPYWHGIFGGLYLHHLRASVFENLIKADAALNGHPESDRFEELSFGSGARWCLRQPDITSYFNAGYGAALEELDFLPKATNLLCTLQRRPEPYHRFVALNGNGAKHGARPAPAALAIHRLLGVKQKGLESKLCYDTYRRLSFLDHFFDSEIVQEDLERGCCPETGDFTDGAYESRLEQTPEGARLHFERRGHVRGQAVRIRKSVSASGPGALRVSYQVRNESARPLSAVFGVELNFSIGEESLARGGSEENVRERVFRDSWRDIAVRLRSEPAVRMTAAPLETVSESESGIEGTYQQLTVLLQRPLALAPGATAKHEFELDVR